MRDDDSDKPEAVNRLLRSFRRHTAADGGKFDIDAILKVSRMREYRDLVIVPDNYEYSFRILLDVPAEALSKTIGASRLGVVGVSESLTLNSSTFDISSIPLLRRKPSPSRR